MGIEDEHHNFRWKLGMIMQKGTQNNQQPHLEFGMESQDEKKKTDLSMSAKHKMKQNNDLIYMI